MIYLDEKDLHSQEGMERAFSGYFREVQESEKNTFNAMLGANLAACDFAGRRLTLRMTLRNWMVNPSGVLHGGISASAMDLTMGLLCRYFSGGEMTPTVSMEVSYQKPGAIGEQLMIRADLTSCGRNFCHAAARAWLENEPERTVCTAMGVYYVSHSTA